MSSIVGRLARTLSQGSDGLAHRRNTSATDEDGVSPRQVVLHRLSASPSFNDFSLSVHEDAEEEYRPVAAGTMVAKPSDIVGSRPPVAMRYQTAVASSPPQGVLPPGATATSPRTAKSKPIKIMGMDPYDYCELLRGSSL